MDAKRILRKLNFLCRAGESIAFRPAGVESGTNSLWMRTPYPEPQPPVDPPAPIHVSSHVARTANTDGPIKATGEEIIVDGCILEVAQGEDPPTEPEIPWIPPEELQLGVKNLEIILKAAKAAKAETITFYVRGDDIPATFRFRQVQGVVMPCRGDD